MDPIVMRRNPPEGSYEAPLEKILVELEKDAWHGYATESLWVEKVGRNRYRLRNVPFYADGLSIEDIVVATDGPAKRVVSEVAERGGHSTYRLFLQSGIDTESDAFREHWEPIENLGCTYERATGRLLAVDVRPRADICEVYRLLERGADVGVWDFEEGHCGHPLGGEAI